MSWPDLVCPHGRPIRSRGCAGGIYAQKPAGLQPRRVLPDSLFMNIYQHPRGRPLVESGGHMHARYDTQNRAVVFLETPICPRERETIDAKCLTSARTLIPHAPRLSYVVPDASAPHSRKALRQVPTAHCHVVTCPACTAKTQRARHRLTNCVEQRRPLPAISMLVQSH